MSASPHDLWERLLALSARGERVELVSGEIVRPTSPSPEHGVAQAGLMEVLAPFRRRSGGGSGPGGWWLMTEVEVAYTGGDVYRHDAVGGRRDRHAERPEGDTGAGASRLGCRGAFSRYGSVRVRREVRTLQSAGCRTIGSSIRSTSCSRCTG